MYFSEDVPLSLFKSFGAHSIVVFSGDRQVADVSRGTISEANVNSGELCFDVTFSLGITRTRKVIDTCNTICNDTDSRVTQFFHHDNYFMEVIYVT